MTKPEQIPIQRPLSLEDLDQRIRSLEKDTRVLKRLYFVKFRYQGDSVDKASEKVGITRMVGYHWQKRWNELGYEGLIPRFAGGRPSKLTPKQKDRLLELLWEREHWTTEEVRDLIRGEFGIEYTLKQIRIILKKLGMRYAKPFPRDHRRPPDAEDRLKKLPPMSGDTVIGFLDETSPQTTANSQRLWSFTRPVITKNTTKLRANTSGFYALNGTSVVDFREHSRKEDVCTFLGRIQEANPGKDLLIILNNFRSHHAHDTVDWALQEGIELVYLPPYSPDLNPLEYIWKSIKRIASVTFIQDLDHFKEIIASSFRKCATQLGYARKWIETFLSDDIKYKIIGS